MTARNKKPSATPPRAPAALTHDAQDVSTDAKFSEVLTLIEGARKRAYQAINAELVGLYWALGQYLSRKIASAEWGDGVVGELVLTLQRRYPGTRGYTQRNLLRMRQFYEAYQADAIVTPVVTQLPWTHHLYAVSAPEEGRDDES